MRASGGAHVDSDREIKPALYSVTYMGHWFRGDALSLEELVERARRLDFEGLRSDYAARLERILDEAARLRDSARPHSPNSASVAEAPAGRCR